MLRSATAIAVALLAMTRPAPAGDQPYGNTYLGGDACLEQIRTAIRDLEAQRASSEDPVLVAEIDRRLAEAHGRYADRVAREQPAILTSDEPMADAERLGIVDASVRPTLETLHRLWRISFELPSPYLCIPYTDYPPWLPPGSEHQFRAHLASALRYVELPAPEISARDEVRAVSAPATAPALRPEDAAAGSLEAALQESARRGVPLALEFRRRPMRGWQRESAPVDLSAALAADAAHASIDLDLDQCGPGARLAHRLHVDDRTVVVFDRRGAEVDRTTGHDTRKLLADVREILAGHGDIQELQAKPRRTVEEGLRLAGLLVVQGRVAESEAELRRLLSEGAPGSEEALVYVGIIETGRGKFDGGRELLARYLDAHPAGSQAELARQVLDAITATEPARD